MAYRVLSSVFVARKTRNGPAIINELVVEYFTSIQTEVERTVQMHMREGISAEIGLLSEVQSVDATVIPGPNPQLKCSSNVVQAFVDEFGASYKALPPFGKGTPLEAWVIAKLQPEPRQVWAVSRGVARAILERGLPSDELRKPFRSAFAELKPMIVRELREIGSRATVIMRQPTAAGA